MTEKEYVIGVDYGSDSVRSLIVEAHSGEEITSAVHVYSRYKNGNYCLAEHNQFRHHPLDYLEGLESTILSCLDKAPKSVRARIRGISIDSTGSTPGPVNEEGTLLALLPEFDRNPNAMFILWKDHTAVKEAAEINKVAKTWGGIDFTQYEGGIYSAEWFWAKVLHTIRADKEIRQAAYSWVEICDWVPAVLTGVKKASEIKRSRCAAGHKAMWHASWGGLPAEEFLVKVDPLLKGLKNRLYKDTYTSDVSVGTLSPEWQKRFGLNANVAVGIGAFDAHMGAVGAGIEPYSLVKIMGTSTCDVLVVPKAEFGDKLIKGICGQVEGSVIPGMIGLEAGQSSFGDVYAWYRSLLYYPVQAILQQSITIDEQTKARLAAEIYDKIIPALTADVKNMGNTESAVTAVDWFNGRRSPDANQALTGALTGLNLGSDAPRVFRALVEATAFGARAINDRFESEGVPIKQIIAIGGVSKKSDLIMQTISDVLQRSIKVCESEQACALGAAMCAATAAGIYKTIEEAQQHMNSGFAKEYIPNKANASKYDKLFRKYAALGAFVEDSINER
jgi:L-ribulokinase